MFSTIQQWLTRSISSYFKFLKLKVTNCLILDNIFCYCNRYGNYSRFLQESNRLQKNKTEGGLSLCLTLYIYLFLSNFARTLVKTNPNNCIHLFCNCNFLQARKIINLLFSFLSGMTLPAVLSMAVVSALCIVGMIWLSRKKTNQASAYAPLSMAAEDQSLV